MTRILTIILIVIVVGSTYLVVSNSKNMYKILPIDAPEAVSETPEMNAAPSTFAATPTPAASNGEAVNYAKWHLFAAPNGKFKVLFPALPQHASENVVDPKTKEVRQYDMYVSEKNDGTIFMITEIMFPAPVDTATADTLLKKAMNDMVESNPKNKLKTMSFKDTHSTKALNFAIQNEQIEISGEAFLAGETLYVLTTLGKAGSYNPKEFDFFTNSFQLSAAAAPAAPKP